MPDLSFRFKKFKCKHGRSSMKIGVDAVLIGAWADISGRFILDVGTGCGIIALMCAQRNPLAQICAIDIHEDSIVEANENFSNSLWSENIKAKLEYFDNITLGSFDLIISNPPFFNSGVDNPEGSRQIARHQHSLSPQILLSHGSQLLNPNGRIAMIVPAEQCDFLIEYSLSHDLRPERICYVRGHENSVVKRVMLQFIKSDKEVLPEIENLTLEASRGVPTEEYRSLCKDFYLKF